MVEGGLTVYYTVLICSRSTSYQSCNHELMQSLKRCAFIRRLGVTYLTADQPPD
jgi:hypothetical protein